MKVIKYISYFSTALLLLSSCSQDDPSVITPDDDTISFVASLPGVESRSTYDVKTGIDKYGITVSAFCTENQPGADGILNTHCRDVITVKEADGVFRGDGCRWPGNRDKDKEKIEGRLKFFAFHPSRDTMKTRAGVGDECFIYSNQTTKDASSINYDFRLTKFRVIPDISKQVDFVTAIGEGNKTDNLYSGIKLNFEHQLCGVEIGVWGAATLYDIEIAGVRIGGIVTEADFNLSTEVANPVEGENTIGSWIIPDNPKRGYVDYVFAPEDKVVTVNATNCNTKDKVSSIMGNGGKAMVIPYHYDLWDYKNDRKNSKGSYFSVLLRMYEREGDHHLIFPSTDPQSRADLVYLVVRKSDGMVMKRLTSAQYDTYTAPDGQEKRAYGWAAVPVKVDWKAGYTYSYVLDYTNGVGVHDPADSNPAIAIIDWGGVEVTTTTGNWSSGAVISEGGWGANSNNTAPDGTVWWK